MNNLKHLELFFGSRDISLLTDSNALIAHAQHQSINALLINELSSLPANSVCITFSREATETLQQLAARCQSGQTLYTQAHAFDPSLKSGIYTLDLICSSDYRLAMHKQEQLLSLLDEHHVLRLTGDNTRGTLHILNEAAPYAMIEEDIQASRGFYIFPLAELLEVHYTHMDPDEPRTFTLDGEFNVSGILCARGYPDPSIPPRLIESLVSLVQAVAAHGATAIIVDNQVRSFTVGARDYCALLSEATGPRGLHLTECAFGVNASIADKIDYRINSQLNEGIEGLHVAVGDGRQGYHIDMLMPGVVATPLG